MKHSEIRRIESGEEKKGYGAVIWIAGLAALFMAGSVMAFDISCVTTPVRLPVLLMAGLFGIACLGFARLKKEHPVFRFAWSVPVLLALILIGVGNCVTGGMDWINAQIASWNALHDGGLAMFPVTASWGDSIAFHLFFCAVLGEISWLFAERKWVVGCCLSMLFWSTMMLVEATFTPVACSFMLVGTVGICLSEEKKFPEKQALYWMGIAAVCLIGFGILTEGGHWDVVDEVRETAQEEIHEARYGKRTLPEGDFSYADRLHTGSETMLHVQTEQDKTLYLKAFVGGYYHPQTGCWQPMPDSAYAGDYAGILKWLKKHGFDPLTQTAAYYALCNESPEENGVSVQIREASREFTYMPATVASISKGRAKEEKDEAWISRGLIGGKKYTYTEISGSRPSELTVAEDWVSTPETEAQKVYCENESVYRNFVYDVYTQITPSLKEDMQDMFWAEYETENDGIYSALDRIRKVLKQKITYTETPEKTPEGEDPFTWGMYTVRSGNSMLYASVAVEAFRAHGIPARYVEGYYVSSDTMESGATDLTGEQAHAWVEVYFDGIGWLPLDVTPGYYYDAVSLRQMVSAPDTVHKTAALENGSQDAVQTSGNEMMDAAALQDSITIVKNVAAMLLGILALLLLILVIACCLAELSRMIVGLAERRRYHQADEKKQVLILQYWIMCALACREIYALTGWKAEETDAEIVRGCAAVEKGEYLRVNRLLEKALYGRLPLEAYEKHTVVNYVHKIITPVKGDAWKIRLRLRYIVVYSGIRFGKNDKTTKNAKK